MRRVRRGTISSELLMCGGGVCSILLLLLVARCMETIDMYLFFVCCGCMWECLLCTDIVEDFLNLGVLRYVVYLCGGCD